MIPKEVRLWRSHEVCRVVNKYNSDFDVNIQRGTIWEIHLLEKSMETKRFLSSKNILSRKSRPEKSLWTIWKF